jgi:hypothetical protein
MRSLVEGNNVSKSPLTWTRGKGEMKRLVATTYLTIALIGPSLAQDVAAVGKKAKPKQSSECRPVGTVKGTKLWAGNCVVTWRALCGKRSDMNGLVQGILGRAGGGGVGPPLRARS